MAQVLAAVHYLHTRSDPATGRKQPVVHRDIKPSNIKRTEDGRYVLVDFGISKLGTATGTLPSMRAMTPGFAPIEQYDGGTDERSDIYSLGATLYAIVTLHIPPSATERSRRHATLAPPRKYNSKLSPRSEQVIERAMMVEPDDRYQSVADMYEDLIGRPITADTDIIPPVRRRKWTAMWLAFAGLLLVAAATFVFLPGVKPDSQPTPVTPATANGDKGNGDEGNGAGSPPPESTVPALSDGATPATALELVAAAASPTPGSTPQRTEMADAATATVTPTATPSFTPPATATLSPTPAARLAARPTKVPVRPTSTPIVVFSPSPTPDVKVMPALRSTPRPALETSTRAAGLYKTPAKTVPATTVLTANPTAAKRATQTTSGDSGRVTTGGPTAVRIVSPPDRTSTASPALFAWEPNAALAEGQVYELGFWQPIETEREARSWTPAGRDTQIVINPKDHPGDYRWGIWLGMFDAEGRYSRIRYLGGGYTFNVPHLHSPPVPAPGSTPGAGSDGGSGGNSDYEKGG